jgi:hypothetical protein
MEAIAQKQKQVDIIIGEMLEMVRLEKEKADKYRKLQATKHKNNLAYYEKNREKYIAYMNNSKHCHVCKKDVKISGFSHHCKTKQHLNNLMYFANAEERCEACSKLVLRVSWDKHLMTKTHLGKVKKLEKKTIENPDGLKEDSKEALREVV